MAPKKKQKGKVPADSEKGKDKEKDTERQEQLHREFDTLTETLLNLKRRADQLRRHNGVVQKEADRICKEIEEYTSYMSKCAQKRQKAIDTLNNKTQQKLEELSEQREEMVKKHEEQVNGMKNEILEKETELAQLKHELAELGDLESVRQQQLHHITELEQKVAAARSHQLQSLHAQHVNSLEELKRSKAEAKRRVQEHIIKAYKKASDCLPSYIRQVSEENNHLYDELQQLIQRAQALCSHKQLLQTRHRQLLQEKEYVQELQHLLSTRGSKHESSFFQLTHPGILDTKPCFD